MAALPFLADVGNQAVVAKRGILAEVFGLGLFQGLFISLGSSSASLSVSTLTGMIEIHKPDVVAVVWPEAARLAILFDDLVPVAGILEPVDRVGMHKVFEGIGKHD